MIRRRAATRLGRLVVWVKVLFQNDLAAHLAGMLKRHALALDLDLDLAAAVIPWPCGRGGVAGGFVGGGWPHAEARHGWFAPAVWRALLPRPAGSDAEAWDAGFLGVVGSQRTSGRRDWCGQATQVRGSARNEPK